MSMAIKASKARAGVPTVAFAGRSAFQGDPGLFGFLGKAIGGITGIASKILPGPLGSAAGLVSTAIGGGGTVSANAQTTTGFFQQQQAGPGGPLFPGTVTINPPFTGAPGVGIGISGAPVALNGGGPQNGPPGPGFHLNKSTYFLKNGTRVEAGTKWVKNRRRNSLNPRAMSRAIARVEGGKKATRRMDRITVRCRRCNKARCSCG